MNLNKCPRCNEFHILENSVCNNCMSKEMADLEKITNYIEYNEIGVENISENQVLGKLMFETGLSSEKIERITENYLLNKIENEED